jgi:hypothetical protein
MYPAILKHTAVKKGQTEFKFKDLHYYIQD